MARTRKLGQTSNPKPDGLTRVDAKRRATKLLDAVVAARASISSGHGREDGRCVHWNEAQDHAAEQLPFACTDKHFTESETRLPGI